MENGISLWVTNFEIKNKTIIFTLFDVHIKECKIDIIITYSYKGIVKEIKIQSIIKKTVLSEIEIEKSIIIAKNMKIVKNDAYFYDTHSPKILKCFIELNENICDSIFIVEVILRSNYNFLKCTKVNTYNNYINFYLITDIYKVGDKICFEITYKFKYDNKEYTTKNSLLKIRCLKS